MAVPRDVFLANHELHDRAIRRFLIALASASAHEMLAASARTPLRWNESKGALPWSIFFCAVAKPSSSQLDSWRASASRPSRWLSSPLRFSSRRFDSFRSAPPFRSPIEGVPTWVASAAADRARLHAASVRWPIALGLTTQVLRAWVSRPRFTTSRRWIRRCSRKRVSTELHGARGSISPPRCAVSKHAA